MINAARANNIPELERLVATGTDINSKDDEGMTALMFAAQLGKLEVAQYLVGAGADLAASEEDGMTALMFAAQRGHVEVSTCLVGAGADLAAVNNNGTTALMHSKDRNQANIVEYLKGAAAVKAPEQQAEVEPKGPVARVAEHQANPAERADFVSAEELSSIKAKLELYSYQMNATTVSQTQMLAKSAGGRGSVASSLASFFAAEPISQIEAQEIRSHMELLTQEMARLKESQVEGSSALKTLP